MPIADLEARYGYKPQRVSGTDGDSLSICTVTFGANTARLESALRGTAGLPTSIPMGLEGVKAMLTGSKGLHLVETKDFGRVDCYSTKLSGVGGSSEVFYSTVCFIEDGRYLNFTMSHPDPTRITFDIVKPIVEKIATPPK